MKKKSIIYSDLSKKQLDCLKELYIHKKVKSLSENELREFVREIINHQIKDTIGKEEETEAWDEMSNFFGEEFEQTILEIQEKYQNNDNTQFDQKDNQNYRVELLEKNNINNEKKDMWDD